MINPVDALVEFFAPERGLRRKRARAVLAHARAHEGASRADGWRPRRAGASANTDHRFDARELRVRARALQQNVPYIARGLNALVSATIGTGITPLFTGKDAEKIGAIWDRWASVADADAIFNVYGLQAAAVRAMHLDGEVLIRRRARRPADGLPAPLQVQLLEVDWLDSDKQGAATDGGVIVNGIEYDRLGKPRAYWIHGSHPGDGLTATRKFGSTAVPASEIIHLFAPTRPGQGRGVTRLHAVVARTRDFMLYEDAEQARKNLESRLSVLASGDASALGNPDAVFGQAEEKDENGNIVRAASQYGNLGELPSGGITQIPPALNITQLEPKIAQDFVPYCTYNLHLIAAGIGVPYESMTGDMTKVNFSSARIRRIEFRNDVEQEQWLVVIPRLCDRICAWFLEAVELSGAARVADVTVDHSTPRWEYVNPHQDVGADAEAIGAALLSPSEALRRRGYKPKQVFAEMGTDFKALQASGALELMQFLRRVTPEKKDPPDA